MHDAIKIGGVIYHQLPASGYLDHGYYCYTPLFFREMAAANGYEVMDMCVTAAGESRIDALQIPSRLGNTLLSGPGHLSENNRIPALNIHVILQRTSANPFRCGLEIATAHAPVDRNMAARYGATAAAESAILLQQLLHDTKSNLDKTTSNMESATSELEEAKRKLLDIQRSRSWRLTAPLRYIRSLMS
jgi:hypothetical protein